MIRIIIITKIIVTNIFEALVSRCIDNIIIIIVLPKFSFFKPTESLQTSVIASSACVHWTNRFHVAVRLFSNRSQMTSKCGKNKKVAHEAQPSVSLMFLPHFDVLCDLLLNRRTAIWNLFVLSNKKLKYTKKCLFISHFATSTDTKIAPTWANVYTNWSELIGCYA